MGAAITALDYYLPTEVLTNAQLALDYPDWSPEKIKAKTGIDSRHVAAADETSLDMAVKAGLHFFETSPVKSAEIDYVLLCTQSPDYFLPTSACILQERLGLPAHIGALDFNLGCSGFVYGLSLAKGLIESGQAQNVLLFTSETYSKFIGVRDRNVRTLFGDAAAVTLIQKVPQADALGSFVFGTNGNGSQNLIVRGGGMRERARPPELFMNGSEIFTFTLREIPVLVRDCSARAGLSLSEIDLFVFHQANQYMLDHLRRKLDIPEGRFMISLDKTGNTVSSTIPIALKEAVECGRLARGNRAMLVGFGVGYSWAAAIVHWI